MSDTSIPQGHKRCTKCGEIKAIEKFHKNKTRSTGYQSSCKECRKIISRKRYEANSEMILEVNRRWRQANPDKIRAIGRRYRQEESDKVRAANRKWETENIEKVRDRNRRRYQADPERRREYARLWGKANPDKIRINTRRRRARVNNVIHAVPTNIEEILFDVQNGYCMYCKCELLNGYHLDHIVPLFLADLIGRNYPGHVPSNLCLACEHCNDSKKCSLLEDWLTWKYPEQVDEILQRVEKHIELMKEWE